MRIAMARARFVNQAVRAATRASGAFRHGAVVVRKGRVVASGCNRLGADARDSVHAEAATVARVPRGVLRGATMFVARIGRDQRPLESRPCARCQRHLVRLGMRRVYYTTAHAGVVR
jgi:tRNA(Arg) A34 adenosine deaminase TadA